MRARACTCLDTHAARGKLAFSRHAAIRRRPLQAPPMGRHAPGRPRAARARTPRALPARQRGAPPPIQGAPRGARGGGRRGRRGGGRRRQHQAAARAAAPQVALGLGSRRSIMHERGCRRRRRRRRRGRGCSTAAATAPPGHATTRQKQKLTSRLAGAQTLRAETRRRRRCWEEPAAVALVGGWLRVGILGCLLMPSSVLDGVYLSVCACALMRLRVYTQSWHGG